MTGYEKLLADFHKTADEKRLNLRIQCGAEWMGTANLMKLTLAEVTSEGPVEAVVLDDQHGLLVGEITHEGGYDMFEKGQRTLQVANYSGTLGINGLSLRYDDIAAIAI